MLTVVTSVSYNASVVKYFFPFFLAFFHTTASRMFLPDCPQSGADF
jgi:hypothetical protein